MKDPGEEEKMDEVLRDLRVEIGRRFVAWRKGGYGIRRINRMISCG